MAYEIPVLKSATNRTLVIQHPVVPFEPRTVLSASVSASGTTLTVLDNVGFTQNDHVLIGVYGANRSEIKRITAAVTAGTSLTVAALTFDHSIDVEVRKMLWNQVEISGATTVTGTKTVIATTDLTPDREHTTYVNTGTEYTFYFVRYYNSNSAVYSEYSDAAPAAGYDQNTVRKVKESALNMVNEKISDIITDDFLNTEILNCDKEIWAERNRWSWSDTYDSNLGNTVEGGISIALPSDIANANSNKSIFAVRISSRRNLDYITKEEWDKMMINQDRTTLAAPIGTLDTGTFTNNSPGAGSVAWASVTITYNGTTYTIDNGNTSNGYIWLDITASTTVFQTGSSPPTASANIVFLQRNSSGTATRAVMLTDSADFDTSGDIRIAGDTIAYTANDTTNNILTGVTGIDSEHANGVNVWQGAAFAEPTFYTVQDGSIYFDRPVSSDWAGKNVFISYYRTPTVVNSDADTVNIPDETIYHYYLSWKILLKLNNGGESPDSQSKFQLYENRKRILMLRERTGQRTSLRPRLNTIRYPSNQQTNITSVTIP